MQVILLERVASLGGLTEDEQAEQKLFGEREWGWLGEGGGGDQGNKHGRIRVCRAMRLAQALASLTIRHGWHDGLPRRGFAGIGCFDVD